MPDLTLLSAVLEIEIPRRATRTVFHPWDDRDTRPCHSTPPLLCRLQWSFLSISVSLNHSCVAAVNSDPPPFPNPTPYEYQSWRAPLV